MKHFYIDQTNIRYLENEVFVEGKILENFQLFKSYKRTEIIFYNKMNITYFNTKKKIYFSNQRLKFHVLKGFEKVEDHYLKIIYNNMNEIVDELFIKEFSKKNYKEIFKYLKEDIYLKIFTFQHFDINFCFCISFNTFFI
jgi:hypothetical protein